MEELADAIREHREVGKILSKLKDEVIWNGENEQERGWRNIVNYFSQEDGVFKADRFLSFLKMFRQS